MIEQSIAMGHRHTNTRPVIYLSEGYRLTNRIEDAIRLASQALDFARDHKRRADQAWALRALGEIASQRDPVDAGTAEASYRQAVALADELGMRPLVAHCHLGLGKFYGRVDNWQQAREHLATATAMYHGMAMRSWQEQAEAALGRC